MRNILIYGTTKRNILRLLLDRLPETWKATSKEERLILQKGKEKAVFQVVYERQMTPRKAQELTASGVLVLAPFVSPQTQRILRKNNINYVDGTGNAWVVVDAPGLFVETVGEERSPWPQPSRSLQSLKGSTSGRVIRGLCDGRAPMSIRGLAKQCNAAVSSVSRVTSFLEEEGLLIKDNNGSIVEISWKEILIRWADDYGVFTSNKVWRFVAPRGLKKTYEALGELKSGVVTGSFAAVAKTPITDPRVLMLYCKDVDRMATQLQLAEVEKGGDVILLSPYDDVVFENTFEKQNCSFVSPSQIAVDLLTSGGRGASEAELFFSWMKENDWRS